MVYVVSSCKDVVLVVDMVNDEFYVVGIAPGSLWCEELPAIAVMVRDGVVEDGEALWGRVVCTKLGKIQISVERVRLWGRGASVNEDWLRGQRGRWGQGWRHLRGLQRGRAQAVAESKWSRRALNVVDEGSGSRHGMNDDG